MSKKPLFGTHSSHELKRITPSVEKIEDMRKSMQVLSDAQLISKTDELRSLLASGSSLDEILPEAFAVVREAARRVLGMEPYPVQLTGGIVLHQGRIAEMRTGEGKTLVCTMPAYLNALTRRGVHVVTVNDYLAERDAKWMGGVYRFLGLTVGCVLQPMQPDERRAAYACDITYVTNSELGFDYLRDNMAVSADSLVLRGLDYCIIDEADSVLIDEARTPLIISGKARETDAIYGQADAFVKTLSRGDASGRLTKLDAFAGIAVSETGDFTVDEKKKLAVLTESGVRKAEEFFDLDNYADGDNLAVQHAVEEALQANYLMKEGIDYIVRDDDVLIVDPFTGRVMPGRRFGDGLHQAIEAKEGVSIRMENRTLATITYQNFFNKYRKKGGMTGTAGTDEQEFRDIYGMDVVTIPTNRPVARIDREDEVYKTADEKYEAVTAAVVEAHAQNRPVLVGTASVESSERVSDMLAAAGIPHQVLNAKYHEKEAAIIAEAGKAGAVTVATNMAGRGTDIKPDAEALRAGGLLVLGTERNESRRIDNQLQGRSGRQGDPGESRFYISLEDRLLRLSGPEGMMKVFRGMNVPHGEPVRHKLLSSAIEKAQKRMEWDNYNTRKSLLEYDRVNNDQRELIYAMRMEVLQGKDLKDEICAMAEETVSRYTDAYTDDAGETDLTGLVAALLPVIPLTFNSLDIHDRDAEKIRAELAREALDLYKERDAEFARASGNSPNMLRTFERAAFLRAIDRNWTEHIDDMDILRQYVGLVHYARRDPKAEYRIRGFRMFDEMTCRIREDTLRVVYRVPVPAVSNELVMVF